MLAFASESNKKYLTYLKEVQSYAIYLETTIPSQITLVNIRKIEALLHKLRNYDNSTHITNALIKASTLLHTSRDDEKFTRNLLQLISLLKAIK